MMRILVICYEDLSGNSGSNRQVLEFCRGLSGLGYEVTLSAPSIGKNPKKEEFRIIYLPVLGFRPFRYVAYILSSSFLYFFLFCYLRPGNVLIFESFMDIGPLLNCLLFGKKFVFYNNSIIKEELGFMGVSRLFINIAEVVQGWYVRASGCSLVVTRGLASNLLDLHGVSENKIKVLKNGVDTDIFYPLEADKAKQAIGLKAKNPVIGFVGSLYEWHGVDYLLFSAPLILQKAPDCVFLIVGNGRTIDELKSLSIKLGINNNVVFTGEVSFDKDSLYVNASDVCVVFFKPVRTDQGDPMKLYEYLSCGRPVVASDIEGYGALVEKLKAGVSVDASNAVLLADVLVRLLADDKMRLEMGRNGREAAEKFFSWKKKSIELDAVIKFVNNKPAEEVSVRKKA